MLDHMREIGDKITQVNREVDALVPPIMEQIRLSEDEVSRLSPSSPKRFRILQKN